MGKRFNMLGAFQLETDIRVISSFFTSIFEQAVRHKLARLFEMVSILGLESAEELKEIYGEQAELRLTSDEVRTLIAARVDFGQSDADLEGLSLADRPRSDDFS